MEKYKVTEKEKSFSINPTCANMLGRSFEDFERLGFKSVVTSESERVFYVPEGWEIQRIDENKNFLIYQGKVRATFNKYFVTLCCRYACETKRISEVTKEEFSPEDYEKYIVSEHEDIVDQVMYIKDYQEGKVLKVIGVFEPYSDENAILYAYAEKFLKKTYPAYANPFAYWVLEGDTED